MLGNFEFYNRIMIGLIIPPGEIKKLLEKTAEHVAHNGSEFEKILMQREQHKQEFAFLKPDSPYRAYYDHHVAEVSKKLLQGIKEEQIPPESPQDEEAKIQIIEAEVSAKVTLDDGPKQNIFLEQIFTELKEPDPPKYIAELPQKLSEGEQAIIQHTAQYAAKNGRNFLVALSEREKNNPHFQFLRPNSKNNEYFNKLVNGYTSILEMSSEEIDLLALYLKDKEAILSRCKTVFEYHNTKQQQARGKKEQQAKQAKDINIDWNDFQLVETISFEYDQNRTLSGGELLQKIQQHAPQPKTMEESIISEPKKREILQQCHACRQNILASEMNRHLKTCLGQKKKNVAAENAQGDDVDIRRNLQGLSIKRPDIFGAQQNLISMREEQQPVKAEKVIFDGQLPNLTRTSGGIAMLNYQQKKLKEQQLERQKNK